MVEKRHRPPQPKSTEVSPFGRRLASVVKAAVEMPEQNGSVCLVSTIRPVPTDVPVCSPMGIGYVGKTIEGNEWL